MMVTMRRWTPGLASILLCCSPASGSAQPVPSAAGVHPPAELTVYRFQGAPDAANVRGTLVADASGSLYGTSIQGGGYGGGMCFNGACGAVFKLTPGPSGYSESVIYSFRGDADGWRPYGNLVVARSGVLFGVTVDGGGIASQSDGTIFSLAAGPTGYVHRVVYRFAGGRDGVAPLAGLVAGAAGTFYGTTSGGGNAACAGGCGTVFRFSREGRRNVETVLYAFQGGADGSHPQADLRVDRAGDLYGTTNNGGGSAQCIGGCGTVFKLTPSHDAYGESVLYAFGGSGDGAYPQGSLIADATVCNFNTGCGTVFKLARGPAGYTESLIYRFAVPSDANDGDNPVAELAQDASGSLYGTTLGGGSANYSGYGTVFRLTPAGQKFTETVLHRFSGGSDGKNPYTGLWMRQRQNDVQLFGTTGAAGDLKGCSGGGCGTLFNVLP
jgi:uncharacterized repeat protein (TIGR03803 family)